MVTGYPAFVTTNEEALSGDPLLDAFGARVREMREAAGLTASDFARAAHVTKAYLSRLEHGKQNVSLRSISRLSLALNVEMAALLAGIAADPATLATRKWIPRGERKNDLIG